MSEVVITGGAFEVIHSYPQVEFIGMLILLIGVTSVVFILVLLACGMRTGFVFKL